VDQGFVQVGHVAKVVAVVVSVVGHTGEHAALKNRNKPFVYVKNREKSNEDTKI
jgi:hypothetical protein